MIHRKIKRISTGSKNLDDLLLGGIETHAITEFYGSWGAGKSQICYTLAMIAALSNENEKVIYVDTEGKFRPERLATNSNWLSNILYVNAMTTPRQEDILENSVIRLLDNRLNTISLLIVDSIINNYRSEFLGPSNLPERQQRLYRLMELLSRMAQGYGIAVVVTNQINSSHSCTISHKSNSTGGNVMTYVSDYKICLRRYNGDRIIATIVKSPFHLENSTKLVLSEKGIDDLQ